LPTTQGQVIHKRFLLLSNVEVSGKLCESAELTGYLLFSFLKCMTYKYKTMDMPINTKTSPLNHINTSPYPYSLYSLIILDKITITNITGNNITSKGSIPVMLA